ncbi:MAG: DUF2938 domain-containing protein [Anaerolineales bacterium]|nr:DUF2938 domain-containing protein [Anaerolineales bacterium]
MNSFLLLFLQALLLGLGATLTFDLWGLLLKHAFKIAPSNICLVGRWLRYMPERTFRHANIAASPAKRAECKVGWLAHYTIGVAFAVVFVTIVGSGWFRYPTLFPALLFGIGTVFAPFFILQPAFGLGIAAAKTANPEQARIRSLMNHLAFGWGLYLFGLLISKLV